LIAEAPRRGSALSRASASADLALLVRRLDWVLLFATAGLVAYGLWAVSGITRFDIPGDADYYVVRQAIAAGIGAGALVVALVVPPSVYLRNWRTVYGITICLMLLVLVWAEAIRGSRRWIDIGPFQFQPSEFGKVLFVLAISGFLVERSRRIRRLPTVLAAVGLAGPPMVLVFLQPDLGTALVYAAALAAVLLVAGVRWLHLALLTVAGSLVVIGVLWLLPSAGVEVLKPYQTARRPDSRTPTPTRAASPTTSPSRSRRSAREASTAVASARRARPGSTTSPSTPPTSCSRRSPSSAGSSAPPSCCFSTSS
jgi:cell division protein FtsW (lipid II flippase)